MSHRKSVRIGTIALCLYAGVLATAAAAPIFSDSFNYPAGTLAGNGPPASSPAGQGVWTNASGGATVANGVATVAGLGASLGDDAIADTAQVGGSAGGTVWVGFLINQAGGAAAPGGFAVVNVGPRGTSDGIGIGMLFNQNVYGIDNDLASPVERAQTTMPCDTTATRLVVKLNFDTGLEYIFVNPATDGEPSEAAANASQAMTSAFRAEGINEVLVAAGANQATFNVGELRLGTAFADVVPGAATLPTVSLAATVPQVVADGGGTGSFTVTRTGDLSTDLLVTYSIKGTARAGVDYTPLKGTKKLKAGKASAQIKVKPLGDLDGAAKATVKLTLVPSASYAVGTAGAQKVKIVSGP